MSGGGVTLRGISSMAMRKALADLARAFEVGHGHQVVIESVGGVVAARRVASGEAFDFAILASDAVDALASAGDLDATTCMPLAHSSIAVAVASGTPVPDLSSGPKLREALLGARRIGYSTGPSGDQLVALFERWSIDDSRAPCLVQAPPGIPVATLVRDRHVDLGVQQLSELIDVQGVNVAGVVPPDVAAPTVFAGGVCRSASNATAACEFLRFVASAAGDDARRRNGLGNP